MSWEVLQGDCVERMRELPEASVDAIVTDPPYLIGFMGKEFDSQHKTFVERKSNRRANSFEAAHGNHNPTDSRDQVRTRLAEGRRAQAWHQAWATEALRVLKPGGHLLAAGGTRTFHRLVAAIEDAGFEIRDCIAHMYGSGFPKSHNGEWGGTALKPAFEPWTLARKPLSGTVEQNWREHGTGALNIDGCRIGDNAGWSYPNGPGGSEPHHMQRGESHGLGSEPMEATAGRWPANVVLSHLPECEVVGTRKVKMQDDTNRTAPRGGKGTGATPFTSGEGQARGHGGTETIPAYRCAEGCPIAMLDEQSGDLTSGKLESHHVIRARDNIAKGREAQRERDHSFGGDSGGASRFFYTAKSSRGERNAGLDGFERHSTQDTLDAMQIEKAQAQEYGFKQKLSNKPGNHAEYESRERTSAKALNSHPTVKPIDLMRWLVRLVTPPGGTVLDPFVGSGTTGIAAVLEGFDFIGIERESEYVEIARARIEWWSQHQGKSTGEILEKAGFSEKLRREYEEAGQMGLEL